MYSCDHGYTILRLETGGVQPEKHLLLLPLLLLQPLGIHWASIRDVDIQAGVYSSSAPSLTSTHAALHQVNPSTRILPPIGIIALCLFLFTISPAFPFPPPLFFTFVLALAVLQSAVGALLQSGVVSLASLFGGYAIQAFFAGQAAIGIFVSLTQLLTTYYGIKRKPNGDGEAEEGGKAVAAALFFGIGGLFLGFTTVLYLLTTNLPAYKEVVRSAAYVVEEEEEEDEEAEEDEAGEGRHLIGVQVESQGKPELSIIEVAKLNKEYNIAVAYVFVVTLVSTPLLVLTSPSKGGFSVRLSAHNRLNPASHALPSHLRLALQPHPLQRLPLPHLQHRGLHRPRPLLQPSLPRLLQPPSPHPLPRSHGLYPGLPGMQPPPANRTVPQLGHGILRDLAGVWSDQRMDVDKLYDRCDIVGAQREAEKGAGAARRDDCPVLPCRRVGDGELHELCCPWSYMQLQPFPRVMYAF